MDQHEEPEESEDERRELPSSRGSMTDEISQNKKGSRLGFNLFITHFDSKNRKYQQCSLNYNKNYS